MAIFFDGFESNTGAVSTYWRITHINVDYSAPVLDEDNNPLVSGIKGIVEVKLHGYISKEARENGKSPIDLKTFNIPATDISIDAISRGDLYVAIMSKNGWETATEV